MTKGDLANPLPDGEAKSLVGRVAIVTGGSRGIGRGIARELSCRGASVAICARSEDQVGKASRELSDQGPTLGLALDLANPDAADELVDRTVEEFGHVDTLVCSHGIYDDPPAGFLEFSAETFEKTLQVNLVSSFRCASAAARAMVRDEVEDGRIVFISSVDALAAEPRCVGYNASKAGLVGLAKGIAVDLGSYGITANVVAPGWVSTPMTEQSLPTAVLEGEEPFELTPLGRIGMPTDIGHAVGWICDPQNRYMTGSVVVIDGGQTAALTMPSAYDRSDSESEQT